MDPNHLLSAFPLLSALFGLNTSWHAFVRGMQGGGGVSGGKKGSLSSLSRKVSKKKKKEINSSRQKKALLSFHY